MYKKQIEDLRPPIPMLAINNGTTEGAFCEASTLDLIRFGSLLVFMSEFASILKLGGQQTLAFVHGFAHYYDNEFVAKSIKGDSKRKLITSVPVCVSVHSDPRSIKIDPKTRQLFDELLYSAFCRRFAISFLHPKKYTFKRFNDKETREQLNILIDDGEKLYSCFEKIQDNSIYVMTPEAKEIQENYREKMYDLINSTEDKLLQLEYKSRDFKVAKLSCLLACLNHPEDLFIYEQDTKEAINIMDYIGEDFNEFLKYKPVDSDEAEKILNFFKENLNIKFTQTDFITDHCQDFGFSRKEFRKNIDEIIESTKELAYSKGFTLIIQETPRKNGKFYYLIQNKPNNIMLSYKILTLDKIVKVC